MRPAASKKNGRPRRASALTAQDVRDRDAALASLTAALAVMDPVRSRDEVLERYEAHLSTTLKQMQPLLDALHVFHAALAAMQADIAKIGDIERRLAALERWASGLFHPLPREDT